MTYHSDPRIGASVGKYQIVGVIGRGGMGRVYLGVHSGIGARVALKIIEAKFAGTRATERFFSEARAVNIIKHESIVNVLDLKTLEDGSPCIVMEYLEGASLVELLAARKPLPVGTVGRLMCEVLDALEATHRNGIIHRDLKPDNIFVTTKGRAKLLDFGIAKLQEPIESPLTMPGKVVGTTSYMAPEQYLGDELSPRTDLFAAGIVLWEAWVGKRLFRCKSYDELIAQHADVRSPSVLRPEVDERMAEVALRALRLAPAERWPDAASMRDALHAAVASLPSAAHSSIDTSVASRTVVDVTTDPSYQRDLMERSTVVGVKRQPNRSELGPNKGVWPWRLTAILALVCCAVLSIALVGVLIGGTDEGEQAQRILERIKRDQQARTEVNRVYSGLSDRIGRIRVLDNQVGAVLWERLMAIDIFSTKSDEGTRQVRAQLESLSRVVEAELDLLSRTRKIEGRDR
jgi:serine/threonine protein kinase